MLIFCLLAVDFLVAALAGTWLAHAVLAYLLALLALPSKEQGRHDWRILVAATAFLITDFAVHGSFGQGFLYVIPAFFLLNRLKVLLVHGAVWLVFIGFSGFFLYEWLLCPASVTLARIVINFILGYIILLGLRGNHSFLPRGRRGRKVWTPSRKDAS